MRKNIRAPRESELTSNDFFERQQAAAKLEQEEAEQAITAVTQRDALDFDRGVVANYLKNALGLKFLKQKLENADGSTHYRSISLFKPKSVNCREYAEHHRGIQVKVVFRGNVPAKGVPIYFGDIPAFNNYNGDTPMTVVSAVCTSYDNKSPHHLASALNIMEDHKIYKNITKARADGMESLGGLRHACTKFQAKTQSGAYQHYLHVQHNNNVNFHYGCPEFMTSTFGIFGSPLYGPWCGKTKEECTQEEIEAREHGPNLSEFPDTLWNGIVRIPQNTCKDAKLPLYSEEAAMSLHKAHKARATATSVRKPKEKQDDDEGGCIQMELEEDNEEDDIVTEDERKQSKFLNASDEVRIRCWYALDLNHILTWPMNLPYGKRRGFNIVATRLDSIAQKKKTRTPVCWLVPDTTLRLLIRDYNKNWQDRIDIRHDWKNTVAFVIAPDNVAQGDLQNVELTFMVSMDIILWRTPDKKIAPAANPNLANIWNFVK